MSEPPTVTVTGSFRDRDGMPVGGQIRFTPLRMWVVSGKVFWATLAAERWLDEQGAFTVQLTPTDSDAVCWQYLVHCPAGRFRLEVPMDELGHELRDLIENIPTWRS